MKYPNVLQDWYHRFQSLPIRSMTDEEILSMLLACTIYINSPQAIAKELLSKLQSLTAIISTDDIGCFIKQGCTHEEKNFITLFFRVLRDVFSRLPLPISNGQSRHILSSLPDVLLYCNLTIGFKTKEYLKVFFLSTSNTLITDETISGTIDKVSIYPREITRQAIVLGASAIIVVHNHPGSSVLPSKEDIIVTQHLKQVLEMVSIKLHDHIIVSKGEHYSFKAHDLI